MNEIFDELLKDKREQRAALVTLIFLGGGFLALWVVKAVLGINADSVFIAMLLLPLIVYLVVSGRISELKTPGGLEAKFRKAAEAIVAPESEKVEPEDVQVPLEGKPVIQRVIPVKKPDDSKPIVMTVTVGKGKDGYSRAGLFNSVEVFSRYRNFKFVVFLDRENKFVSCMPAWAARSLLQKAALGDEFVQFLNNGEVNALQQYPGIIQKTITTEMTNLEALEEMTRLNIEALIVIDEEGKLAGVVEREQILSKLMLSLLRGTS